MPNLVLKVEGLSCPSASIPRRMLTHSPCMAQGGPSTCEVTEWSHPKLSCAHVLLQPLSLGQVVGKDIQAASMLWTRKELSQVGSQAPRAGGGH